MSEYPKGEDEPCISLLPQQQNKETMKMNANEVKEMKNETKKEMVVNAINGMNRNDLKKMVSKYIKYVPGSSDEEIHPQAIEIYNAIFAEMYEKMNGIKADEDAPKYGECALGAVKRIHDILDGGILVRGIYRELDDNTGAKITYLKDNITFKKSRVFVAEGASITVDDINRFSYDVDVFLIGDGINKELGL